MASERDGECVVKVGMKHGLDEQLDVYGSARLVLAVCTGGLDRGCDHDGIL
jgi:hypothetical protein